MTSEELDDIYNQYQPILEVSDLTIEFETDQGRIKAVEDISFKINKGETVGIVGESGSGKSVTALAVMRLIQSPPGRISSGRIIFHLPTKTEKEREEVDILKISSAKMRSIRGKEIAMIFQEPMTSLNPVYTCGNQVIEAILQHENISVKEAKKRTLSLFERVKLEEPKKIFRAFPHQISGGQKQRVMIAMALACQPSLLIADEPTTALDVTVQKNILQVIQELREERNTATLFITHDLGVIGEVADRVIVMYKGKIVEEGEVWEIFSKPKHPYTKGLLACRPRLDVKLQTLPTVSDFMVIDDKGQISEFSESRFKSVGEALMKSFQSIKQLKERHDALIKQEPLLVVNHLKVHYPTQKNFFGKVIAEKKAVDNISFKVYPGETLGLVGESGCGKTTLGRSIMRLIREAQGEILYQGEDILSMNPKRLRELRKDVQIIFQDPYSSLNPRITVGEAIMEPMRIHNVLGSEKERRARVMELLDTVELHQSYFNRYPHEFSGGQRQRVCIARTLAVEPKFIICDESVSALDVSVQARVLNLLNSLKKSFNLTYIFISHDLSVVKFISDRIMVMNQGQIVESGFPEDIYKRPTQEYTQTLIKSIPRGSLEDIRKAMLKRRMAKKRQEDQKKAEKERIEAQLSKRKR